MIHRHCSKIVLLAKWKKTRHRIQIIRSSSLFRLLPFCMLFLLVISCPDLHQDVAAMRKRSSTDGTVPSSAWWPLWNQQNCWASFKQFLNYFISFLFWVLCAAGSLEHILKFYQLCISVCNTEKAEVQNKVKVELPEHCQSHQQHLWFHFSTFVLMLEFSHHQELMLVSSVFGNFTCLCSELQAMSTSISMEPCLWSVPSIRTVQDSTWDHAGNDRAK